MRNHPLNVLFPTKMSIFPINQDNNHTDSGMLVMVITRKGAGSSRENPPLHCTQAVDLIHLAE